MAKKTPKPGRTLGVFFIVVVLLYGAVLLGGPSQKGESVWHPKLGLDLEGGTRITLTATKTPTASQLALARNIIDSRANGSGVSESSVSTQGGRNIVVEIPGKNSTDLVNTVKRTAQLRFRLVATGSPQAGRAATTTPSASPTTGTSPSASASPSGAASGKASPSSKATAGQSPSGSSSPKPRVAPKLDTTPTPSATSTPKKKAAASATPSATPATPSASPSASSADVNGDSVADQLAWMDNPPAAQQQKLAAYTCPAANKALPPAADDPDKVLITCDDQGNKFLLSKAVVEGTSLRTASYGQPQGGVGWAVDLRLKGSAVKTFGNITTKLSGTQKLFAIVLDGKVISYATVSSPILNGQPQITGSFTQAQAKSLSNSLKYGALPLRFDSTVDQVGPSLAGDQLSAGVYAGVIGLVLVMLYCLLYYRGLGLVVISSLLVAGVITYGVVLALAKTAGFTLTLPGIAGLIVAVGITADSFIVYFERIRDEMRTGKSMRVAVELGWARARNTCLAADAVSLLAAIVLYIFTIGVVRGFAFALGISTLIDLAVFFWFTKPSMTALARLRFFSTGHRLSGLSMETLGIDEGHHSLRGSTAGGRL